MVRTSSGAVQAVLAPGGDYDLDLAPSLAGVIDEASLIVDRVAVCAAAKGKTLTAAELEMIERLLAAHCYAMSDQTYASKSTGGRSGSFHGQTGLNLDGTKYGQRAQTVDWSGCLTALGKRQTAGAAWLGKPLSEQIPYVDRN